MRQRSDMDAGCLHRVFLSWALQARSAALSQLRAAQEHTHVHPQVGHEDHTNLHPQVHAGSACAQRQRAEQNNCIDQQDRPLMQQLLTAWSTCARQSRMHRRSQDVLRQILVSWSRRAQRRRRRRIAKAQGQSPNSVTTAFTNDSGDDTAAAVTGSEEAAGPCPLAATAAEAPAGAAVAAESAAAGAPDSCLAEAAAATLGSLATAATLAEAAVVPSTKAAALEEHQLELITKPCRELPQSPTDLRESASQELARLHSTVQRLSEEKVEVREATASQVVAWEAVIRVVEESRATLWAVATRGEAAKQRARALQAELCWAQASWAFATWHRSLCLNQLARASRLQPPPLWSG